uniref:Uncharacterized protein n=1 Tax=viral metagenome TaxID=1070528 RepID=A0A6M3J0X8_9ZZZZ
MTQNGIFLFVPRFEVEKEVCYKYIDFWLSRYLCGTIKIVYSILGHERDGWNVLIQHSRLPSYEENNMIEVCSYSSAKNTYPWMFKENLLYRRF